MMLFTIVKRYYDLQVYKKDEVKQFVKSGKITPRQYQDITGDVYVV